MTVLARVTVRNDGDTPLPEIALQVSSSLRWESVSQVENQRVEKVPFHQHLMDTDADRTGKASEAIVHLLRPLAPHATAELTLLYSGQIGTVSEPIDSQDFSSSDSAAPSWRIDSQEGAYLRGFGHDLWYPVASPQVFRGEGASLLQVAGREMFLNRRAEVRLRLSVVYTGEGPGTVFFCENEQPLTSSQDNPEGAIANSPGVATAEFPVMELGFRTPTLLVTGKPVSLPGFSIAVVSTERSLVDRISLAARPIRAFLQEWFGQSSFRGLTVVDHPGEPFIDTGLLVAPMSKENGETLTAELLASMTRTRLPSSNIWLEFGTAQFVSWIWTERTQGRPAALAALEEASHGLALAESVETNSDRSLLDTYDPVFYRSKSALFLWMLRDLVGDPALKQAFQRYARDSRLDKDPHGFQKLLEEMSGKSLGWIFDDWVYHDRGLPELSILSASSRPLPAKRLSDAGRLVAVEVRNDGGAAAEVPVTVRSGTLTATERLRINAHSVASVRVLFQGTPEEVQVNDGTVPEMISDTHVKAISPD